jgi:hypothetical protein
MDSSSTRGPFGFRIQSGSPVLGCLFTLFALIIGLSVALFGVLAALIMPVLLLIVGVVRRVLGKSETVQMRHEEVVAIDVESTVLPPERITGSSPTTHEGRD